MKRIITIVAAVIPMLAAAETSTWNVDAARIVGEVLGRVDRGRDERHAEPFEQTPSAGGLRGEHDLGKVQSSGVGPGWL